jgi:hypothetical protein
VPVSPAGRTTTGRGEVRLGPLLVAACAAGIGIMAQTAFVGFVVSAAVAADVAEGTAGLVFASGSAIGLVIRIALGHHADGRGQRPLVTSAAMMGASAGGFLLLATERPGPVVVAILVLCATAWGWQGLFFLAVARSNAAAPATASGIAATGMLTGAVIGPVVFGLLARDDYATAWVACAAAALVSAAVTLVSHRLLRSPAT